ncbi:MAG: aspartate-semialdehyde dehydrogenase [bacterium]
MASNPPRIGILGATGAVGSTILQVLAERGFEAAEVVPLASERSAGSKVAYGSDELEVRLLEEPALEGLDLVLSSAGGSVSEEWAPKAVAAGAVVVDNTSFWRMNDKVPLVISEVNPEALDSHMGIVANPNCSTMQMVVALAPLHRKVGVERIVVSTYQSVSGTGRRALEEMRDQSRAMLAGNEPSPSEIYPHRIAFNVIPQVESFKGGDDYTTEERKMMDETRKILGAGDEIGISATCARVPVEIGHAESINLTTSGDLSPERCRELLAEAPGVVVADEPSNAVYPLPSEVAGVDDVYVGRIRRDPSAENTLNLWVVGDNLRKGAATNAVQLAETLIERDLVRVPSPSIVD